MLRFVSYIRTTVPFVDAKMKIKFRRFGTPFSLEPKHVKSHVSAVPIAEYIWAVHTNTPPLAKHCTAAQA